ncbi:ABC transporter ATP-binding protein [Deinococcus yavapaiensis]|uniref:ABC-2 type transport system ATP-binding protein n=1 Tax=Deinococcus yavapaiensis KR-236 TaxID=694435 RepID=A0A318SFE0_9DEIO|nr:ABC transporter ATP-binding protein [Deinococcus yavapaiensis]PYE55432.1 ABC-2 type transport system ATP-binding protein [Deinococcus yavapaiensis KR-236]
MQDTVAIHTEHLSKRYGRTEVIAPLSLTVASGIVFGYLGPNGAGKTTTIRMLSGVLPPSSGTGTVAGASLSDPEAVKARIGYANQAASVYGDLTVEENVRFKAALYLRPRDVGPAVNATLERLGLARWRAHKAAQLSGGWRQRLCIGTAVVHEPRVLFLDEPTAGLDPVARRDLWDVIYDLTASGTTVFVTTHYMDEAERCQELALLADGHLLAQGTPQQLRAQLPGVRYALRTPHLAETLHAARALDGVTGAWIIGDEVRVVADDARTATVLARLGELREVTPSLEDVFVAYAGPTRSEVRA